RSRLNCPETFPLLIISSANFVRVITTFVPRPSSLYGLIQASPNDISASSAATSSQKSHALFLNKPVPHISPALLILVKINSLFHLHNHKNNLKRRFLDLLYEIPDGNTP